MFYYIKLYFYVEYSHGFKSKLQKAKYSQGNPEFVSSFSYCFFFFQGRVLVNRGTYKQAHVFVYTYISVFNPQVSSPFFLDVTSCFLLYLEIFSLTACKHCFKLYFYIYKREGEKRDRELLSAVSHPKCQQSLRLARLNPGV